MSYDWLIVGLGNPGTSYAGHRHNIGFMAVDTIANGTFTSKFKSLISEETIAGHRVLLMKPQTFMNVSGDAVREAAAFYKIPEDKIAVIHDELDLEPGQLRIKQGGGNGGHNGLRSLDAQLPSVNYWRLRCGIGHPGHKDRVSPYVLSDFAKEERETWLPEFLGCVAKYLPEFLNGDPAKMMTRVAEAMKSPA